MTRARSLKGLVVITLVVFAVSYAGSLFVSSSVDTWYAQLEKPPWNPPAWLFAPVWTLLYLMMAVSAWLVWRAEDGAPRPLLTVIFLVQLLLNLLWPSLFFGLRMPGVALLEILLLLVAIAIMMGTFYRFSRSAAYLLVPYLLWVGFATALTATLWWLN